MAVSTPLYYDGIDLQMHHKQSLLQGLHRVKSSFSMFRFRHIAQYTAEDYRPMNVKKSDLQWQEQLTREQYRVCREKETERAFTGEYTFYEREGSYHCVCCQQRLFDSTVKFDAGCGWPSFYDVTDTEAITLQKDLSLGMERIEVMCSRCDAHLGHLFPDGPEPTGLRYCINSIAMRFQNESE